MKHNAFSDLKIDFFLYCINFYFCAQLRIAEEVPVLSLRRYPFLDFYYRMILGPHVVHRWVNGLSVFKKSVITAIEPKKNDLMN